MPDRATFAVTKQELSAALMQLKKIEKASKKAKSVLEARATFPDPEKGNWSQIARESVHLSC